MKAGSLLLLAVIGIAAVPPDATHAQSYPAKPVRFVVPFPPGGGTDLVARLIALELSPALGTQVVIDNRAGAQGSVGAAAAAKATADGHTIVLVASNVLAMNPWIYKDVGYDPVRDFSHITLVTSQPPLIVTNPRVPARSLKELAALARKHPDLLTFASSSSSGQLAGELFKMMTGTRILHIAYKGASPAMLDVVGGRVDLMFSSPPAAMPMVKAGKLAALAVAGPKRLAALADVPTAKESGLDFDVSGWYAVSAPAGTPRDIVAKLNSEIVRAIGTSSVRDKLLAEGLEPRTSSPEAMSAYVKTEYERWGAVVKSAGLKPE